MPRLPEPRRAAVLVHGAGGGGWEWVVWARVLRAGGWDVRAPDLAPAAAGLAATGWNDYRAQVRDWLAQARRAGGRVALVGASLGGQLALAEAAVADALVLVNPMPPDGLPGADDAGDGVVPWGYRASLAGTRRALPDADDAAMLLAFRSWRDESARVMAEARAGRSPQAPPGGPVLVIASSGDDDVPPACTAALAADLRATLWAAPGSHVGPLLGRQAPATAAMALAWLNAALAGS